MEERNDFASGSPSVNSRGSTRTFVTRKVTKRETKTEIGNDYVEARDAKGNEDGTEERWGEKKIGSRTFSRSTQSLKHD